jgi:hypothetical protein
MTDEQIVKEIVTDIDRLLSTIREDSHPLIVEAATLMRRIRAGAGNGRLNPETLPDLRRLLPRLLDLAKAETVKRERN